MNSKFEKFTPFGELLVARFKAQQQFENRATKTEDQLQSRLRSARKRLLGTGRALEPLITENGSADDAAIYCLVNWLTAYTAHFAREGHHADKCEDLEDFLEHFYRYSLYMYTTDSIGDDSIDDLIQLAECYDNHPDVFAIVAQDCLPKDMVDEMQTWVGYPGEHPTPPEYFVKHVSTALGALLGAMRAPENLV